MPGQKHYVYSARTTEKGLALLNKAKGNDQSWDTFISAAVAEHYNLPLDVIALPPSKFLEGQKANRDAKEAEKAARKAEREAKANAKAEAKKTKKATAKTAEKPAKKGAGKKAAKPAKTVGVTVAPGETKVVHGTHVHADKDNTAPMTVPVEVPEA